MKKLLFFFLLGLTFLSVQPAKAETLAPFTENFQFTIGNLDPENGGSILVTDDTNSLSVLSIPIGDTNCYREDIDGPCRLFVEGVNLITVTFFPDQNKLTTYINGTLATDTGDPNTWGWFGAGQYTEETNPDTFVYSYELADEEVWQFSDWLYSFSGFYTPSTVNSDITSSTHAMVEQILLDILFVVYVCIPILLIIGICVVAIYNIWRWAKRFVR